MHTRTAIGAAGAVLAAAIAMAAPAQASSAGSLDPSFGSGGLVTLPSGVGSPAQILVQPNGLIDVISTATDPATGNDDMAVVQYKPDGKLNTSFGTGGEALASFPGFGIIASSGFLQSNGRIVLAGGGSPVETVTASGTTGGGPGESAVAEFNSNGTLDSSFGTDGEVITQYPSPVGPGDDQTGPVLVEPNGDILTGGGVRSTECNPKNNPKCTTDDVVTRYTPDGSLDTTFGKGGFAEVNNDSFSITAMAEDAKGDIFVQNGIGGEQPTLGEYSPAGAPDATVSFPSTDAITVSSTGAFQPNGTFAEGQSIKLTSNTFSATAAEVVLKSLPTGAADSSFSNTPFDFANKSGSGVNGIGAIAFESDGDVVAAGIRCPGTGRHACSSTDDQVGVARLTSTGSLDTTFGSGGVTTLADGNEIAALAVVPKGDILVAFGTTIAAVLSS
jgi:uncharacterized delta-60 repeat protein